MGYRRLSHTILLALIPLACFTTDTLGLPCGADKDCLSPQKCVEGVCSGDSGSSSGSSTGEQTGTDDTGGGGTDGGGTSDGGSADGGSGTTGTGGGTTSAGGTTSGGSTSTGVTTSATTTGGDTSSDTTTDTTTSTSSQATNHLLQHHDGDCDTVLWCTVSDVGYGPHQFAECFLNVTPTPPFDLLQVRYNVGAFEDTLPPENDVVRLHVYQWDAANGQPNSVNGLIATQDLARADISMLGPHTIVVNPAIEIDVPSFCIAIDSNGPFGISRDDTGYTIDRSFQIDQCGTGNWEELEDLGYPGNWCISATIYG